jgi:hypothetical protein
MILSGFAFQRNGFGSMLPRLTMRCPAASDYALGIFLGVVFAKIICDHGPPYRKAWGPGHRIRRAGEAVRTKEGCSKSMAFRRSDVDFEPFRPM